MNDVLLKLKDIKNERDKLSPEIIKKGVTVFGITGTYTGETTDEGDAVGPSIGLDDE